MKNYIYLVFLLSITNYTLGSESLTNMSSAQWEVTFQCHQDCNTFDSCKQYPGRWFGPDIFQCVESDRTFRFYRQENNKFILKIIPGAINLLPPLTIAYFQETARLRRPAKKQLLNTSNLLPVTSGLFKDRQ